MVFDTFLFDVDGTVFLSEEYHFLSFKDVLEKYGFNISKKFFFEEALGMNSFQIFKKITSFSDDKIKNLIFERNKVFLEKYCSKVKLVSGAFDFILFLKNNNFKIAFVTNGTEKTSKCMLEKYNFNFPLFSSDVIVNPKPNPEGYLKALKFFNSKEGVVFEDTKNGIIAGKKANCKVVALKTERYSFEELHSFGADLVVEDYNDKKLMEFLFQ